MPKSKKNIEKLGGELLQHELQGLPTWMVSFSFLSDELSSVCISMSSILAVQIKTWIKNAVSLLKNSKYSMYFPIAIFSSRHFLLIDVLSMSELFTLYIFSSRRFLLFVVLSRSTNIFYLLCFVSVGVFPFDVLSHSAFFLTVVRRRFLLSAFFTLTFCR
jgi:hypothetical protein